MDERVRVPRTPTPEMLDAARHYQTTKYVYDEYSPMKFYEGIYDAMLAAAPVRDTVAEAIAALSPAIAPAGVVTLIADDVTWFEDAFRAWEHGDFVGVLDGLNRAVNHFTGAGR